MISAEEAFAISFLVARLDVRDDSARRTARIRTCLMCDQPVYRDNPLQLAQAGRADGHDPDCRALEIYHTGFDGQSSGGGGLSGPTFGDTGLIFDSTTTIFGDS